MSKTLDLSWIRLGLQRPGKSQRGLAAALGIDPSGVSRLLNGRRELKAAEIVTIARYLEVGPPFAGAAAEDAADAGLGAPVAAVPARASLPRDLPVRGLAVGGAEAGFDFNGEVVDYVRRPPGLSGARQAFAVFATGESMAPRFEEGELVFVHPGRPATPGCDVIVEMKGRDGEPGRCYLKRLVRRTEAQLLLRQFNPPRDIALDSSLVRVVYRVMSPTELLGI